MLFRETVIDKWLNDAKYINAFRGKVQRFFYGSIQNTVKKQLLGFVEQRIAKLCAAGYVITKMVQVHVSNINTIKSIYYTHFNVIRRYGIICGCNSSKSGKIFILHKKGILLMAATPTRTSSRSLFKHLEFIFVLSQFIYSH